MHIEWGSTYIRKQTLCSGSPAGSYKNRWKEEKPKKKVKVLRVVRKANDQDQSSK